MAFSTYETLLDGVTATTTSKGVDLSERADYSLQFSAAGGSPSGVFTVELSNDNGTTWTAYNRLISNVTNTNSQSETRVANVTLGGIGSAFLFIAHGEGMGMLRVILTTATTTSSYSCFLRAKD